MKTHYLEFVPLEPQPKDGTYVRFVKEHDDLTNGEYRWARPSGWSALETTTQELFGRLCWVRMADHLVEHKGTE